MAGTREGKRKRQKAARVAKNLLLDSEAVHRGEEYSRLHGTNLSRLVSDFLRHLPVDTAGAALTPVVARFVGIAAGGRTGIHDYREYLYKKYGGK